MAKEKDAEVQEGRVFVDDLNDAPDEFAFNKSANLVIMPDTDIKVLRQFADHLYQGQAAYAPVAGIPRYVLSISARVCALAMGAIRVTPDQMNEIINLWMIGICSDAAAKKGKFCMCEVCGCAPGEYHDEKKHVALAEENGTGGDIHMADSILADIGERFDPGGAIPASIKAANEVSPK